MKNQFIVTLTPLILNLQSDVADTEFACVPSPEQQQAERHHRHTGYQAVNGVVVLAVLPGGGEQLVQRDEDHDAGDRGKHNPEKGVVEERG